MFQLHYLPHGQKRGWSTVNHNNTYFLCCFYCILYILQFTVFCFRLAIHALGLRQCDTIYLVPKSFNYTLCILQPYYKIKIKPRHEITTIVFTCWFIRMGFTVPLWNYKHINVWGFFVKAPKHTGIITWSKITLEI